MRTALYARYSDGERQNDRSIDDQNAALRRHAAGRGWTIVATLADRGIPGFALANRPAIQQLLAMADAGEIDLVLTEDEDRLARNQEHLAHIANRLDFAGVGLATLETDQVDDMRVAFKGLIGQRYLKELGKKTARSMRENAERGLATGSRLYGYASEPGGKIDIVEHEAEVIRRIHADYAKGLTGRDIADALNREGVPGPRGGPWNRSSITGSRARANGILHTELYAGVKVFGRVEMRKDPRTGKRLPKIRPAEEWIRVPVPHLRILDEADWKAVQARLDVSAAAAAPWTLTYRRRKGLFSGLVRCGQCGGGYITHGAGHMRCAARLERGPSGCGNSRAYPRAELELRVLKGLKARLLRPEAVAVYVRKYHAAWQARRAQETNRRAPIERRIGELTRSIGRLVAAIGATGHSPAMLEQLGAQEAELARLQAELAQTLGPEPPVDLHPKAAEAYARRIEDLQQRLELATAPGAPPIELQLRDAIRGLVDHIEVTPVSDRRLAPVKIEVFGKLSAFLSPLPAEAGEPWGRLVAGGGIEPPT